MLTENDIQRALAAFRLGLVERDGLPSERCGSRAVAFRQGGRWHFAHVEAVEDEDYAMLCLSGADGRNEHEIDFDEDDAAAAGLALAARVRAADGDIEAADLLRQRAEELVEAGAALSAIPACVGRAQTPQDRAGARRGPRD